MSRRFWRTSPPTACQCGCDKPTVQFFVDGAHPPSGGRWGIFLPECFERDGGRIGLGRGQAYEFESATGKWLKIGG